MVVGKPAFFTVVVLVPEIGEKDAQVLRLVRIILDAA
jgi:hypothetical protein